MESADKVINQALDNLPDEYRRVLKKFPVTDAVKSIAEGQNFNNQEADRLDKEVTYLLLNIQGTPDFVKRLEDKLDLNEKQSTEIMRGVTETILKPINDKVNTDTDDIPVPPPPPEPQGGTPNAGSYGGASDPYREPPE